MPFGQDQDMIPEAVAPKCPDQALNIWILPWRSRCIGRSGIPIARGYVEGQNLAIEFRWADN